ncbi:MBL fold metallo-hydrolase [Cycloclasticus pugetii]|uniref:MBL fold metallo-hydrolase n=1 Tax=Cycloclasticus pugetii TaxID=34068 RepID=UPI00091C76EC|nr:MBL fold metallo-hydrolase [Cycloclasticus pugetii]SHJ44575.1 Glyoxylase, beta-lactamase superfamily II [Cycloclasticus pugetii]
MGMLTFPIASKPEFGLPMKVEEGIFLLKMPIPYALDHINLWLLRDGEGWTIIDSGFYSEEATLLWNKVLVDFCHNEPIQKIIITHFHPDHVGMAQWLAHKTNAPVHMSQIEFLTTQMACQEYSKQQKARRREYFERFGLAQEDIQQLQDKVGGYVTGVPEAPTSYQRLVDGQSLLINGEPWHLLQFNGHSPGHICLHNKQRDLLVSGDQILPNISPNVSVNFYESDADPLADYLSSLGTLATLGADTVVLPSHGRIFKGIKERATMLKEGHRKSLDQILAFCQQARSGLEVLHTLYGKRLSLFNLSLATGEAMAHLNYLIGTGEVTRSGDLVYQYKTN